VADEAAMNGGEMVSVQEMAMANGEAMVNVILFDGDGGPREGGCGRCGG
jgi:hypothetical protein